MFKIMCSCHRYMEECYNYFHAKESALRHSLDCDGLVCLSDEEEATIMKSGNIIGSLHLAMRQGWAQDGGWGE